MAPGGRGGGTMFVKMMGPLCPIKDITLYHFQNSDSVDS